MNSVTKSEYYEKASLSFIDSISSRRLFYKRWNVQVRNSTHGELSVGRTAVTVLGVLGAAAAIRKGGGGGGGGQEYGYAWDYQPGNRQWVCRDKSNGQYARKENCAGSPVVDHWPNN